MSRDTAELENSMKRPDKFQTIAKTFSRKIKMVAGSKKDVVRSMSKAFKTSAPGNLGSVTESDHVTLSKWANPLLDAEYTRVSNADDTLIDFFTYGDVWSFDYNNGVISSLNASDEVREVFVEHPSLQYSNFQIILNNPADNFKDNVSLYIVDENGTEHLAEWDETLIITPTSKASYVLKDTGDNTYNMFTSDGKPMMLKIIYS